MEWSLEYESAVPTATPTVPGWVVPAAAVSVAALAAWWLFSRFERGNVLDHPMRAALLDSITREPGLHFQELLRRHGGARGATAHHLRTLARAGLVTDAAGPRYRCYFPVGRVDRRVMQAASILKAAGAQAVLRSVVGAPGRSNLEVAQALGLRPHTVHYHVQRLRDHGLLEVVRDGRRVRILATDVGRCALSPDGEALPPQ